MKIGLFFGSFNPVHTGHLIIGNNILNLTQIKKIWFVVSPQNPLKSSDLLDASARLHLVRLATETDMRFEVSDIEFHLPTPSYTVDTLGRLKALYPSNEFYLIIGSDNLSQLSQWKSYEILMQELVIVYERAGFPLRDETKPRNMLFLQNSLIDISSTTIRQLIQEGKSARYLVPEPVLREIKKHNYFRL